MFQATHILFLCGQRILDEKHMDLAQAKKHIEALERNTADQKTEVTIFVILNRDGSLMTVSKKLMVYVCLLCNRLLNSVSIYRN